MKIAKQVRRVAKRVVELILAWDDDPGSGSKPKPSPREAVDLEALPLPVAIGGKAPEPGRYARNTAAFRHWVAADAFSRAVSVWSPHVPARTRWQTGPTLPVLLDAGVDLNAFYTRGGFGDPPGLSFFHDTVAGKTVYSGESPDITTHELGHALLDAIRPELWDVMSVEVASFHEAFGDISAVLSALQVASVRESVLSETNNKVFRSSRASRLAEQLGWAVRQLYPGSAETDCLRNAVNSFFYRDPEALPPNAPSQLLSSEPHSFSRVFTGAFVEMLAGIFTAQGDDAGERELLLAAEHAARIVVDAVLSAPIKADYYARVAEHCLAADERLFEGRYRDVIRGAFVRRGILSLMAAARPAPKPAVVPRVALHALDQARFALAEPLLVAMVGTAAAERFVEDLMRRGRIDLRAVPSAGVTQPMIRKTHVVVRERGRLVVRRRTFDCGFV